MRNESCIPDAQENISKPLSLLAASQNRLTDSSCSLAPLRPGLFSSPLHSQLPKCSIWLGTSESCPLAFLSPRHASALPDCSLGISSFPKDPWEISLLVLLIIGGKFPCIKDIFFWSLRNRGPHTWYSFIHPISSYCEFPMQCELNEVLGPYEAFSREIQG